MRPRLRRLASLWRGSSPAPQRPPTPEVARNETERRLEDARRRLKQSVPPREGP